MQVNIPHPQYLITLVVVLPAIHLIITMAIAITTITATTTLLTIPHCYFSFYLIDSFQ